VSSVLRNFHKPFSQWTTEPGVTLDPSLPPLPGKRVKAGTKYQYVDYQRAVKAGVARATPLLSPYMTPGQIRAFVQAQINPYYTPGRFGFPAAPGAPKKETALVPAGVPSLGW
jgi:hypothetical protein